MSTVSPSTARKTVAVATAGSARAGKSAVGAAQPVTATNTTAAAANPHVRRMGTGCGIAPTRRLTPHTGRPTEAREFCCLERSPGREVSERRRQRRGKWTGLFDAFERGVT